MGPFIIMNDEIKELIQRSKAKLRSRKYTLQKAMADSSGARHTFYEQAYHSLNRVLHESIRGKDEVQLFNYYKRLELIAQSERFSKAKINKLITTYEDISLSDDKDFTKNFYKLYNQLVEEFGLESKVKYQVENIILEEMSVGKNTMEIHDKVQEMLEKEYFNAFDDDAIFEL